MDKNLLTREIISILYENVMKFTSPSDNKGCLLYTGTLQSGYGIVSKTFGGHRYRLYAHRAVVLFKSGYLDIPEDVEVSHLCHNKQCVRYDHLIIESHEINNNRQNCYSEGRCTKSHFDSKGNKLQDCMVHCNDLLV